MELFSPSGKCLGKCGQGLFAAALTRKFPWMTVCEETDFPQIADKLVIDAGRKDTGKEEGVSGKK